MVKQTGGNIIFIVLQVDLNLTPIENLWRKLKVKSMTRGPFIDTDMKLITEDTESD